MSDNRNGVERILDAGSGFDWITPTYEAVRNLLSDGRSFTTRSDDWLRLKPTLKRRRIPYWGEAIHWHNGAHWYTFSVHAKHAHVISKMTGYRPTGGRGKAVVMMLVVALFILIGVALAAAVGGGL